MNPFNNMNANSKITYQISEDDYLKALILGGLFSWKYYLRVSLIALLLAVMLFIAPETGQYMAAGGLIGVVIFIVLARYVILPAKIRKNYQKYKLMHDEVGIQLEDEGIHHTVPDGEQLIRWEKIVKWRHNYAYILLYISPRLFLVIPKSIVAKGFDVPMLVIRLTQQVGKAV